MAIVGRLVLGALQIMAVTTVQSTRGTGPLRAPWTDGAGPGRRRGHGDRGGPGWVPGLALQHRIEYDRFAFHLLALPLAVWLAVRQPMVRPEDT
jgi:hypothetical protein